MNFLFVGIDSLRADRLGCYGCQRNTSPFMDTLADEGALFQKCFAPGIPTQPSFTTVFTGQWPTTHGIVAHRGRWQLRDDAPFLPEILSDEGYATVAVDNLADQHQSWFSRGFSDYVNPRDPGTFPDCTAFNRGAVEWLKQKRREPFFMFVHYWDPHTPYMPPDRYRSLFYSGDPTSTNPGSLDAFYRGPLMDWWPEKWLDQMAAEWPGADSERIQDIEFVRSQYDSEVRCADDGLRELVGALDDLGLREETVVVVFGDHGEELGEHGIYFDHHGLYDTITHVPLVINGPGRGDSAGPLAGRIPGPISGTVQLADLAPTVLDLAGISPCPEMDGMSLTPHLRNQGGHSYPEVLLGECTWMAKWALRTDDHKVIVSRDPDFYGSPGIELYDLQDDPGECRNLADSDPELAGRMAARMEDLLSERLARAGRSSDPIRDHGITLGSKIFDPAD